uniref:CSON002537 protein n=1 Tax=Culicoides sonorensis TaxID=179676 RepID=A0A336MKR0_CULSO
MDDDQQFCLRWNNHQSTLISVFDTLLENGTLVDCTLAAEGKFLKAHKVVLSACSPYFAALLSQQYDKHPIFILKDVKFQELRAMMDYMYRGEVNISQDQLAALLKAAESLQIKGLSDNRSNSVPNKTDNIVKPPPPVPVAPKGGLTISDAKRKQLLGVDMDTDLSTVSREGSTSPSRKRKKVGRRRSIDANNVLDNHEHSNSSSHSHTTPHIAAVGAIAAAAVGNVTNNIATSTPIVLPVTKKTDPDHDSKTTAAADNNATEQSDDNQTTARKDGKRLTTGGNDGNETHSELMIEPKNEYDEEEDEEGRDVEDLTLDDEDMMDDMDQAGPSHGGESSSGYGNWQMERSQDEGFMVGQDGGQPRDAQAAYRLLKQLDMLKDNSSSCSTSFNLNTNNNPSLEQFYSNTGSNNLKCPRCSRYYSLPCTLIRHIRYECGVDKQFACRVCGKKFARRDILRSHEAKLHNAHDYRYTPLLPSLRDPPSVEVLLKSSSQNTSSTSSRRQQKSNNIQEENTRFPCNVCNKSYLRKRHLQRHMRDECIGIPPRFHCEYCPSKFRRKYHLVRHLSSKHGIPKLLNSNNHSVTLTHLPSPQHSQHAKMAKHETKSDTDNENIDLPNPNILMPAITMTTSGAVGGGGTSSNVDRFSVDALMMKQEMPDNNYMVPLDFSPHPNTNPEENVFDPNKIQSDITLQRTFQNLKYLFTNFAMNNVPNFTNKFHLKSNINNATFFCISGGGGQIVYNHHGFEYKDIWYNLKFSDLSRLINGEGRYGCPRANCAKTYKDASSLQRHIRYECGGMKKFRCIMCGKAFSQGSHLKRHLESGENICFCCCQK